MKKLVSIFSVVALITGMIVFVPSAKAAVPGGTLTSAGAAPLTVNVGEIVAVPDLTVTDVGAEITLGNDIRIQIPGGTSAVWDTTVLAPTLTPTGVLTVAAAVTYPDSKTLLIDVTGNAGAGDTLLIGGLNIIGITGASAGAALTWSVDAGANYGASLDPNAAITVAVNGVNNVLAAVTATPANAVVSTQNTYTIAFTIPANGVIPADGKIVITFPAGFTIGTNAIGGLTGINGGVAVGVVGQAITITRDGLPGTTNATAGVKSLTVNLITNHATANSTYALTSVATTTAADEALATAASAAFLVNPAAIANLACLGSSAPGTVYLSWTVPAGATGGYAARYSVNSISSEPLYAGATDFATAAGWTNGTVGQSVGAQLVTGLSPGGTYFFNVKARGAGTSLSAISNASTACAAGAGSSSTTTATSRPASSITSPASGTTSPAETTLTIGGVSSDNGVSSIKKVEVSTDGGATWAEALALTANSDYGFSWKYDWTLPAEGPHTIKTRATNWIGVVETPGAGITVTVAPKAGIVYVPVTAAPDGSVAPVLPHPAPTTVSQMRENLTVLQTYLVSLLQQLILALQVQLQALMQ